jgi:hypothetical protein
VTGVRRHVTVRRNPPGASGPPRFSVTFVAESATDVTENGHAAGGSTTDQGARPRWAATADGAISVRLMTARLAPT